MQPSVVKSIILYYCNLIYWLNLNFYSFIIIIEKQHALCLHCNCSTSLRTVVLIRHITNSDVIQYVWFSGHKTLYRYLSIEINFA